MPDVKGELIMTDKNRCVANAMRLGRANYIKYNNCAQATFTAIIDALREEGIELTGREGEEAIFKALTGSSGGYANLGCGNCGALSGAAAAISLASKVDRQMQLDNINYRWIAFDNAAKTIGAKFKEEYYGLTCRHVLWECYGKIWDFWNQDANKDFVKEAKARGYLDAEQNTISQAAGWGTAFILDILEHPRTLEQVKKDHGL
jgi:hypothetical protein